MDDILGLIIGAFMTVLIFSYVFGDNVLYRWALAILVGSAAGYALGIAIRFILTQWVAKALTDSGSTFSLIYAIPLILGSLLIFKGFPPTRILSQLSLIGNIPLGYLVGVGAAVAVAGALTGTLVPQMIATGQAARLDADIVTIVEGIIIILGTISVLYFFTAQPQASPAPDSHPNWWKQGGQRLGVFFLAIGLGTAYAGAISSALTALVIRLWHLADLLNRLTSLLGG